VAFQHGGDFLAADRTASVKGEGHQAVTARANVEAKAIDYAGILQIRLQLFQIYFHAPTNGILSKINQKGTS